MIFSRVSFGSAVPATMKEYVGDLDCLLAICVPLPQCREEGLDIKKKQGMQFFKILSLPLKQTTCVHIHFNPIQNRLCEGNGSSVVGKNNGSSGD